MKKIICRIKGIWRSVPHWLSGNYPISGHIFIDTEEHENCKVTISECKTCGKIDISWSTKDNKYR